MSPHESQRQPVLAHRNRGRTRNRHPRRLLRLEPLEPRCLLSGTPESVVVDGDPVAGDAFLLRRKAADPATLELLVNGAVQDTWEYAGLGSLTINGLGGDDSLTVDRSGGSPVPSGGLVFNGGPEDTATGDRMTLQGGDVAAVTYTATGPKQGEFAVDGGRITFTGLEPITVTTTLGTLIVNVTDNAGHTIVIEDAPNVGETQVVLDGGLEGITFVNPTTLLRVTARGGNDHVFLNGTDPDFAADIEIYTGAGEDLVAVNRTPSLSGSVLVCTETDRDTIHVIPSETSPITVLGGAPFLGDAGVPPGDVLALETLTVIGPNVQHNRTAGQLTSVSHQPVVWSSIETLVVPDAYETNDSGAEPTVLGSLPKITLRDLSIQRMQRPGTAEDRSLDVFLLFDDTGSFSGVAPTVKDAFPKIIADLQTELFGASLAFGVGRFEEYANFAGESATGRPFILNQPVITIDTPDFAAAIDAALGRTTPGFGGDGPETGIEALWQVATGLNFDGNNNGNPTESGPAGPVTTQTSPGSSGDVPAFASFVPDPSGPVLAPAGSLGGVGFRPCTERLVLLATDEGFAYQPDSIDPYVGVGGVTVPAAAVQVSGRGSTPFNAGASIQETVDALNGLGIEVVGLGTGTSAGSAPRRNLEALATLTGAVNTSSSSLDSGIPGDSIAPGQPLYFKIDTNSADNLAQAIVAAITAAAGVEPIPADVDVFQVTAQDTGKLVINAFLDQDVGDLDLRVRDAQGNILAGSYSLTDHEQIVIPVVGQERYFIEVYGVAGAVGNYDLEIENFPAPVPEIPELPAKDHTDVLNDTGASPSDAITARTQPEILIQADLHEFAAEGISILTPAQAAARNVPGAAVQVFVNGDAVGYAEPVSGTGNTKFRYAFTAGQLPETLFGADSGGWLHNVTAAVQIIDGQGNAAGAPAPATGRTSLSAPLLLTVDAAAPAVSVPDLLAASDSGTYADDNVTNMATPAFRGTAEHGATIRVFANGQRVGQGVVGSDLTAGGYDQVGAWEVTVEPLVDGQYLIVTEVEDTAGNITRLPDAQGLTIWIDTVAPNTPYLDLVGLEGLAAGGEVSDTGRNDNDNVTRDNTPTVTVTADDTVGGGSNPFWHEVRYRIYDRPAPVQFGGGAGNGEVLILDSFALLAGLTANGFAYHTLTETLNNPSGTPLPDGQHNLKLEVEDRAGNLSADFLLDVLIDTVVPPVSIVGIGGAADTGVDGYPATFVDRVTSDAAADFVGWAEANAIVRLYVDPTSDQGINLPAAYGLTVALPYDGDNAFPNGQWAASFVRNLNDPALFPFDGVREVLVTAEDLAGNVNTVADGVGDTGQVRLIFVDTQGPRIADVEINEQGNPYDLFDPKPSVDGPTPPVNALVISVIDWPARSALDPNFLYPALFEAVAENPAHYRLIGERSGPIAIASVDFETVPPLADGQPAQGIITLTFAEPLPDDHFTLTISDALVDPAGNALDGENNSLAPPPSAVFPSGDGQPGGAFVTEFTIDTRAEIGVWAAGSAYIDSNGNFLWEPLGQDGNASNEDVTYVLGFTSDNILAGNFAALVDDRETPEDETVADGFHKLAAYGKLGTQYRWLIDYNNDGVPDLVLTNPVALNGLPAAGNFDGNATNGDEVALKVGTTWYLDRNHSLTVEHSAAYSEKLPGTNMTGYPVVGDFDGDGQDDLGARTDDVFSIDFAANGLTGAWDVQFKVAMNSAFIGPQERPIAADFDGDGIDDLGLWVPRHSGGTPQAIGEWYILVSDGRCIQDRIRTNPQGGGNIVDFVPEPFAADLFAVFGSDYSLPVVGNFDPHNIRVPVGGPLFGLTNPDDPYDVDGDGVVAAKDVLLLITEINRTGPRELTLGALEGPYWDVSGDRQLTALDALTVITRINVGAPSLPGGMAGGEGEAAPRYAAAVPATQPALPLTSGSAALPAPNVDRYFTPPPSDTVPTETRPAESARATLADALPLDEILDTIAPDLTAAFRAGTL